MVTPKDIDASELYLRITLPSDDSDRMPPGDEHPEGLDENEISIIRKWIEEGAEWNGHWSFESPVEPGQASSEQITGAGTIIDKFVLERLQKEGLQPAPPAEPSRLLRRLSLDLTGLPPTLEELDAFLSDYRKEPDKTVRETVTKLLSRPGFGEKWSSMWLDLVRYADSRGLGQDGKRNIWPYRDWVVKALNDDMPFDQFTIRQLAGDLLPDPTMADLIATAAHRNTQTNNEGGTDDEEFRTEAVIDRVNTTWQTWGSITFGCVQCHDHPYEPFRHEDYYRFMAFFNNTADSDLNNDEPLLEVPNDPAEWKRANQIDEEIRTLQTKLWQSGQQAIAIQEWEPLTYESVSTSNHTMLKSGEAEHPHHFFTVGTIQRGPVYQLYPSPSGNGQSITGLRLTVLPSDPVTAFRDSEWGFEISDLVVELLDENKEATRVEFAASIADVPYLPHKPDVLLSENGKGFQAWSRLHHPRSITLIPREPILTGERMLRIRITNKGYLLGSFPLVIKRGFFEVSSDPSLITFATSAERQALTSQLNSLKAERKKIPSTTLPVMAERPASIARPTHVFARGNFLEKDKRVTSGLPQSLPKLTNAQNPTRLDMAKWWVSGSHPLTSRVFVNRVWEQLFGTGIVATLEDFGSSGEKPSHPELLDYLALRFQGEQGWSIKSVIREIVLSSTYQQSAKASAELIAKDPANRLLARGPRNRLSAEVLRDQALAIGDLLTTRIGGPPVHPPIPTGVWKPFQGGDKWETPQPGEGDRYRRALYTYTKRSIPFPSAAAFDAPSREFCTPRRLTSNTPLQALTMFNEEAFVEAAEGLAHRMQFEMKGSTSERLSTGFRIATARLPFPEELNELLVLFEHLKNRYQSEPKLTKGNASSTQEAAYTVVAQVILNLDEVLTK